MDTILYDRQKDLNLTQVESAIIVGCGGTGSWVALYLALSGCEEIHLLDADNLELPNFNRLYIPATGNLGRPKAEAIAEYIKLLRPECSVYPYVQRATKLNLLEIPGGTYLFDCTDSQPTQVMLNDWAKENKRHYIRCGYDGTHMTVADGVPHWDSDETELPRTGYETRPSWAVPASVAAGFAVAKAMYEPNIEVRADLNEFVGKACHMPSTEGLVYNFDGDDYLSPSRGVLTPETLQAGIDTIRGDALRIPHTIDFNLPHITILSLSDTYGALTGRIFNEEINFEEASSVQEEQRQQSTTG